MTVRAEAVGSQKAVAHMIVARTSNGAALQGRTASHRVAR
jgi:hypothetical protein